MSNNNYTQPDHPFDELFVAVQMSDIFPDSKTFNDYIPKYASELILEKYLQEKNNPTFNLKQFIDNNYTANSIPSNDYKSDTSKPIAEHLSALWSILTREPNQQEQEGSLIQLPSRYVVPGGRFQEIYYWDSYFTMLGLQASGQIDLIEGIIDNFAFLIDKFGYIPNGNRTYFLGRSQPPFFSLMVELLRQEKGDEVLLKYLPALEKEYDFWMKGKNQLTKEKENIAINRVVKMPNGGFLNRYWDENNTPRPEAYKEDVELAEQATENTSEIYRHIRAAAESGWDFSSRWFKDGQNMSTIHTTDIIPIDLNCLLLNLEKTLFKAFLLLDDNFSANKLYNASKLREKTIKKYCYSVEAGFYFDYDFVAQKNTEAYTLAATFPLFFEIANKFQATNVSRIIKDRFLKDGGLITTTTNSGQQWDAPNGWAPLQYITYQGLKSYGFDILADKIKTRWIQSNEKVYLKTGKMTEKYNVETPNTEAGGGEYPNQDGFGWTNGVFLKFLNFK
ncbi:alpha,alpha-trehalase TreF [Arcicella lustrica]|uniref:Alpha,alpha-trehalase TreF n=1 Tax=Arcicella lustrica TaxID=2984196 RepID=A0ABU5SEI9_9BACT|nr:alpha,alpha-trehalase TreF [Arcicella sp. DC25W]MEA5425703.1 alpha,alpha-trehalase TreF [Arcicella sp. DC25W]